MSERITELRALVARVWRPQWCWFGMHRWIWLEGLFIAKPRGSLSYDPYYLYQNGRCGRGGAMKQRRVGLASRKTVSGKEIIYTPQDQS